MLDIRKEPYFLYTQNSLSTFKNCPLKFKKRYIDNLKWDSLCDENTRKLLEDGRIFHMLANRYFLGIDTGEEYEENEHIKKWIKTLKTQFPINDDIKYLSEYKIRISNNLRLEANIDLISINENKLNIWDWKTHPKGKIQNLSDKYKSSLQTAVYMYTIKKTCKEIFGKDYACKDISMTYWQPDSPNIITSIIYSDDLFNTHQDKIEEIIDDINKYDYAKFDKALYSDHCKYCEFNWMCNNSPIIYEEFASSDDFMDGLDWE
jgi:hypothetical protein